MEPSLILIDRCENAAPNCFESSTWSRAPSLDAVAEGRSVLRFGHRGPAVRELQGFLNEYLPEGEPLAIDGYFGPETEGRLRRFQEKQSIAADGVVGIETMDAMADAAARGLMVDELFSRLPEELQRSALDVLEGTASSERRRVLAEILRSEGFLALTPERQELVLGSRDPRDTLEYARMMAEAKSALDRGSEGPTSVH
jgi:peptidoglycan hydrolase-like protein with peptidoglycan-binding domain